MSITCNTDGNFQRVFCFPNSRINENGGKKNDDNEVHRVFGKVISCLHDNWYHIPGVVGAGVEVVTGGGTERK